jgi:perosamine synthetase
MLALKAVGVRPGDEVIVPALTYAATASSVVNVGAVPVFCDVEISSWQISSESIEQAISSRTRAIVVPHTYGVPADMDPIVSLSSLHGVPLIEDAAEAFGATYKEKLVGTFGSVGTFSFFPNKLITSGEGGLCVARTPELKSEIDLLRGQGMNPKLRYVFEVPGYNFRMTGIQAALLYAHHLITNEDIYERSPQFLTQPQTTV